MIFRNNTSSIGSNSTIDELVIVRTGCNQMPFIEWRDLPYIVSFHNGKNNISGEIDTDVASYDFRVFFQDFIRDA